MKFRSVKRIRRVKTSQTKVMASLFSRLLVFMTVFSSFSSSSSSSITSPRALDMLIRDFAAGNIAGESIKTGVPKTLQLSTNLSGVAVTTIRLRCGSLRRYGAHIGEFRLPAGAVAALPCVERVLLIRQSLGHSWSKMYYKNNDFRGYKLVSPILGLLAYNAGDDIKSNRSNPFEVGIYGTAKNPIKVDFKSAGISSNISRAKHYCATFDAGKIKLLNMVAPLVCVAEKQGHFALVTEPPRPPPQKKAPAPEEGEGEGRASRWKVAVGSSVGAALGAFLLGLLVVAMVVRAKERTKVEEERVRRAYEEEALEVSMVGHVRAPVATPRRTAPTIEHHYRPPRL